MMQTKHTTIGHSALGLLPPFAILFAAGALVVSGVRDEPHLAASTSSSNDADGDGLVDRLEKVLGTSSTDADTDHDGYSDAEELARHSSTLQALSRPGAERGLQIGMSCYGEGGLLHLVVALYSTDHNLENKSIHFGMYARDRIVEIPPEYVLQRGMVDVLPAHDPAAMVTLLEVPLDPHIVQSCHDLTVFATVGYTGSGKVTEADTVHLLYIDGMVVLSMRDPNTYDPPPGLSMMPQHMGGGHIYRPLPTGEDEGPPPGWTEGEICYQETSTVAARGAYLMQEVVTAECVGGWDGYCAPSCSSSVGSTFTTIDPVVLIGG